MARGVHFRGTVASVYGYAIGSAGSESIIITASSNIQNVTNLTTTAATITSGVVTNISSTNLTADAVKLGGGTITASSVSLAASTLNSIVIGPAITGWNNAATALSPATTGSTINLNANSFFTTIVGTTTYASHTYSASGGFIGQRFALLITAGGTGGPVTFAGNPTFVTAGTITVTTTSIYLINFVKADKYIYEISRTAAIS